MNSEELDTCLTLQSYSIFYWSKSIDAWLFDKTTKLKREQAKIRETGAIFTYENSYLENRNHQNNTHPYSRVKQKHVTVVKLPTILLNEGHIVCCNS